MPSQAKRGARGVGPGADRVLQGTESELEAILANRLAIDGLPLGVPQHRFVPSRQFRFDRAWPAQMVAAEVQGGTWSQNGHARPSMIQRDCLKLSIAAALGWRVLPLTREMIEDGTAVALIRQALGPAAGPAGE